MSRYGKAGAAVLAAVLLAGWALAQTREATNAPDHRAARGKMLAAWYGCGSCHRIQPLNTAVGRVGPPLDGVARRAYLAGRLPNTPENMIRWIQHPRQVDAGTVMPEMGVTEPDARLIAEFLYTLR